jgi:histidine ammonia-lyase
VKICEVPDRIREVVLDGRSLSLEEIVAVARYRARVRLDPAAARRVGCSRAVVERLVADRAKVYGLTTGFGSKRDILIEPEELGQLQENLIRSHACGVGDPLREDEVRAAMLLRANTLARGNSGVRPVVIEALLEFLNRDVYPWIPSKGSLGASGDLAPLSHLALSLCNDPEARFYAPDPGEPPPDGPRSEGGRAPDYVEKPAAWRFGPAPEGLFGGADGLVPLVLEAKEGLALNNGTQVSVAIGILTLFDAIVLLESAELACALSLEATKGVRDAFDPRLHAARPLEGQPETAANILAFTEGSQILNVPLNTARLHRARWAMGAAAEILEEREGTGSRELAARARALGTSLAEFENATPDLVDRERAALSAAELDRLPERALNQRIYREALGPIRGEVLALYAALLEAPLAGEAVKGRDFLADAVSQLQLALPEMPSVQDDYSFRCTPQVIGATRKVVEDVRRTLVIEANSATDNPLIFPPRADEFEGPVAAYADSLTVKECLEAVVSGGNFHGEPVAIALDTLGVALAELGSISERRTAHLVDGNLSNGLPSLLVERSGLNNGLMIPQYVAAALVSENKVLCHPASVDSIPTCENTEDHVSMSPLAALKCRRILENVETVVAIELLTAWQGVYFRRPFRCGRGTERLWEAMEEAGLRPVRTDRVLYRDIEWSRSFLRGGGAWHIARTQGAGTTGG